MNLPSPRPVRVVRSEFWWLPYAVVAAAWVLAVAAVVLAQFRH